MSGACGTLCREKKVVASHKLLALPTIATSASPAWAGPFGPRWIFFGHDHPLQSRHCKNEDVEMMRRRQSVSTYKSWTTNERRTIQEKVQPLKRLLANATGKCVYNFIEKGKSWRGFNWNLTWPCQSFRIDRWMKGKVFWRNDACCMN